MKNKLLLTTGLVLLIILNSTAQTLDPNKKFEVACVGFYNVENLYDTIDSPNTNDSEYTPTSEKKWNSARYNQKLNHLARVLSEIGTEMTPSGAAVIGLCEIENRAVLEDLVKTTAIKGRNYGIVHYDSPDRRGVDVAFLYQPAFFKVTNSKSYTLKMPNDTSFKTRDQLLVSGNLLGERFHFIIGHWPSRRGGEERSAPLRFAAAQLALSIMDSIRNEEPNAKIILMGDLNDDPKSKSIKKVLKGQGDVKKLKPENLFNASEDAYNKGIGTLAWRDAWNLFDQMIMTQALVDAAGTYNDLRFFKFKVYNKPYLATPEGSFAGYPFRSYVGNDYKSGYSDHFSVYSIFIRESK